MKDKHTAGRRGATKAREVLADLIADGWTLKRCRGSHRVLAHVDGRVFVFAFHDGDEIGPRMLARIRRGTTTSGLRER